MLHKQNQYTLLLTDGHIAIIKAALQAYSFTEEIGYAVWSKAGGSIGTKDLSHCFIAVEIYDQLEKLSKVKPYMIWSDFERIAKLLNTDTLENSMQFIRDETVKKTAKVNSSLGQRLNEVYNERK